MKNTMKNATEKLDQNLNQKYFKPLLSEISLDESTLDRHAFTHRLGGEMRLAIMQTDSGFSTAAIITKLDGVSNHVVLVCNNMLVPERKPLEDNLQNQLDEKRIGYKSGKIILTGSRLEIVA